MTTTRARILAAALAAVAAGTAVTLAVVSRPTRTEKAPVIGVADYRPGDPLTPPPAPEPGEPVSTVPGPYGPIYPDGYTETTAPPSERRAPVDVPEATPEPEDPAVGDTDVPEDPTPSTTTPTGPPAPPTPTWTPGR